MNIGVNLACVPSLGAQELIPILIIALIVFGANKLPKIAKDLGSALREFKKTVSGEDDDEKAGSKKDDSKKDEQKKDEAKKD